MSAVEDFLEKGKLLSPGILEEVDSLGPEEKEKLAESDKTVITSDEVKKLKLPLPEINYTEEGELGEVHISQFTEFYLDRFEFLKGEVKDRLDGTNISSINNLSSGKSSIIGMVRETGDGEVLLEDKTGELTLKTDENFLEDEVVGVKGEVIKNKKTVMSPKKIIYPDVPIGKKVETLDQELKALFVSEINEDVKERLTEINPDYIFCASEKTGGKEGVVHISDEPGEFSDIDPVRCSLKDLTVLIHDGTAVDKAVKGLQVDTKKALTSLLKKRHLDPVEMHSLKDRYLIKEVPDIIHISGEESVMTNYKGVTLLSTTEEKAFLVNLKTREVEDIEL